MTPLIFKLCIPVFVHTKLAFTEELLYEDLPGPISCTKELVG